MSAPEKIWAWDRHKSRIDGNSVTRGVERDWAEEILPDVAASISATEYIRADLIPSADYVAYTQSIGIAGDTYIKSVAFKGEHHLPAQFRWHELWDAMNKALAARPDQPAADTRVVVEEIECVSFETGFEEPAGPIWRIELNGYCADFESHLAAANFAAQIRAVIGSAKP